MVKNHPVQSIRHEKDNNNNPLVYTIIEQPKFSVTTICVHRAGLDHVKMKKTKAGDVCGNEVLLCCPRNTLIGYFQSFKETAEMLKSHQLCFGKTNTGQCGYDSQGAGSESGNQCSNLVQWSHWEIRGRAEGENKQFPCQVQKK